MNLGEIIFIQKCGFSIRDEREIITSDDSCRYSNVRGFLDEVKKITEIDVGNWHDALVWMVYNSCMMYYSTSLHRDGVATERQHLAVMEKGRQVLKEVRSSRMVGLTLLYEGPAYLHPETLSVYQAAGHKRLVDTFSTIFRDLLDEHEAGRHCAKRPAPVKAVYLTLSEHFLKARFPMISED